MNIDKTLFAQVMEFAPWKNFSRIIDKHGCDAGVKTLNCADLFRVAAFSHHETLCSCAQLGAVLGE